MKILITGFDPFGGEDINPAYEAVKMLPNTIEGAEIYKVCVPTIFYNDGEELEKAIRDISPDAVICVGQAGGRNSITVEKIAINLIDARIPDNAGKQPIDEKIAEDGPDAYFATLPVKDMVESMRKENIPAAVSYTAGTFVCNDIMYRLLHYIKMNKLNTLGGFIHVPFLPEQTISIKGGAPSMSATVIRDGLEAGIKAIILNMK